VGQFGVLDLTSHHSIVVREKEKTKQIFTALEKKEKMYAIDYCAL
jgi:hypothetical protein